MAILHNVNLQLKSDIIIKQAAYIFFGFTTNLSSKYIVKANNINVTSCALAAIKSFNKYKSSNTNISDVNLFFVSLELEKYIAIPNKNENHYCRYINSIPTPNLVYYIHNNII